MTGELSKGFTGIEINGVRFSNIKEMLIYMDKQRDHILELEKENKELKCECRRCVYTDCPCVLSDYGKDKNGICDHFKDVFDENAELKAKNKWYSEQVCNKECAEVWGQITKAKEIINTFVDWKKGEGGYDLPKDFLYYAEQFISEVEK